MQKDLTADEIIDAMGGTSKTAHFCGIKPPSVSEWRRNGIPAARLQYLRLARPEIFKAGTEEIPASSNPSIRANDLIAIEDATRRRNGGIRAAKADTRKIRS